MKFLIDVNLSPDWCDVFRENDLSATHWSSIGDISAPDSEIMAFARAEGLIVFTHDLDFGTLLYQTSASSPSVVQLRSEETRPAYVADIVVSSLLATQAELLAGAILTIEPKRDRIRLLPVTRK